MKLRRLALHVGLPLTLGAAIYLLLRRDDIALFRAVDALGLGHALDVVRGTTRGVAAFVPRPIFGSAPDALWSYAFGAALALVWAGTKNVHDARIWLGLGFMVALAIEIAQALRWIPGVFDPVDLLAIAGGYALGVSLGLRNGSRVEPIAR